MLDSWPFSLLIGIILGFLSGLGVGGGSLLLLWLTSVLSLPYPTARIFNLLFFLPCAVISSLFRWKESKLSVKKILPAIVAGCISAGIFSVIGSVTDTGTIQKLFGGLLLITGLRELLYKPKDSHSQQENRRA